MAEQLIIEQPTLSKIAALLQAIGKENNLDKKPGPESFPPLDTTQFSIGAVGKIEPEVTRLFDTLPNDVQEAVGEFLSGDESTYQKVPKAERSKLWRIMALLALLALFLVGCGPRIFEVGQKVELNGQMLTVNTQDWFGGDFQRQSVGCSIDTSQQATIREVNGTGEYYLIQQGDCSGWIPHTRIDN